MKLSGSAQRLLGTIQRWTVAQNYVDVVAALDELVDGQKKVRGSHVEEVLGGLYRGKSHWEKTLGTLFPWRWIRLAHNRGGQVVRLGPLDFELGADADQSHQ